MVAQEVRRGTGGINKVAQGGIDLLAGIIGVTSVATDRAAQSGIEIMANMDTVVQIGIGPMIGMAVAIMVEI